MLSIPLGSTSHQDDSGKWGWLTDHLEGMVSAGKVLIFVSSKQGCEELAVNLNKQPGGRFACAAIHGDKDQYDRLSIIKKFKHGEVRV
jgi:ATP-dependent RNA helicase DDX42